jgi:hypothetical protein
MDAAAQDLQRDSRATLSVCEAQLPGACRHTDPEVGDGGAGYVVFTRGPRSRSGIKPAGRLQRLPSDGRRAGPVLQGNQGIGRDAW